MVIRKIASFGLLLLLFGCASGSRVKIGELVANPQKYNEKYVTVGNIVVEGAKSK
jgi:hypothetical protein